MNRRSAITGRWDCQLIKAEAGKGDVLLDLVALDACPFEGVEVPAGWPFVVRIIEQQVPGCAELVTSWAEQAEIVALRVVYSDSGSQWLDLAAADQHLILELK